MTKPIYVIGHRNPDTDSICSAIGYAYLKNALGENTIAARVGKINTETRFVLESYGVDVPMLLTDLFPRVRDIMSNEVVTVLPNDTLCKLGNIMKTNSAKSIVVVDDSKRLLGIVSLGDLAKRYFEELEMQDLGQAEVDLASVLKVLDGMLLTDSNLERKVVGKVRIAAGSTNTIHAVIRSGDVVLVGDREDAQLACLEEDIDCLIITGGVGVSPQVHEEALRRQVTLIKAPYDTYTCARLINQSIPIAQIMQSDVSFFKPTDLLSEVRKIISRTNYRNYPVVENGKLVGIINRDRLFVSERDKVILVDHNERSQAVEGIEEAEIVEIVDHHRLGGLTTSEPIFIRHEPVGCTATIIASMYWHRRIDIPPTIAALLLAAIVSDTALFKSPTSTEKDRETAEKLAETAKVELFDFGMSILKAGSSIAGKNVGDIIRNDMKEFQIGEYKMAVGQISVMDTREILSVKKEIHKEMEQIGTKEKYDMVMLMVTDLLNEGTYLIYSGEAIDVVERAFPGDKTDGMIYLPGVMSRKKQVIPPLVEATR